MTTEALLLLDIEIQRACLHPNARYVIQVDIGDLATLPLVVTDELCGACHGPMTISYGYHD